MWKRMQPCAAQQMQALVTGDGFSWALAPICQGRNLICTSRLTPVVRNVMRFDKMGAGDWSFSPLLSDSVWQDRDKTQSLSHPSPEYCSLSSSSEMLWDEELPFVSYGSSTYPASAHFSKIGLQYQDGHVWNCSSKCQFKKWWWLKCHFLIKYWPFV